MELIVVYLVFAVIVGAVAGSWGRSGFLWFLLSLLISPLITIIILLIAGKKKEVNLSVATPRTHVLCPDCAEPVKKEARVCKHCGCKLVPEMEQPR